MDAVNKTERNSGEVQGTKSSSCDLRQERAVNARGTAKTLGCN